MSLIHCPECGKEVSDKSDKCIHCGYPLKQKTIINGVTYDLSSELKMVLKDKNIEAIKSVRDKTGLGLADSKSIIDYMVSKKKRLLFLHFKRNNLIFLIALRVTAQTERKLTYSTDVYNIYKI